MSSPSIAQQPTHDPRGRRALIGEFRPGELLKTSQAAEFLATHPHTVRGYMKSGLLAFRRLRGGHSRIPVEALEEFLRASDPLPRAQPAEATYSADGHARSWRPAGTRPVPRQSAVCRGMKLRD